MWNMAFGIRWKWWRARRRSFPHDEIHRAGDLAETRLAKLSRAAGKANGWHIYESVRIPDPEGGRREIDMVLIAGNTMLVVEQKHWAGSFEITKEHHFVQNRNNGSQHNHDGVADRIARKADLLSALHNKRLGLEGKDKLSYRVIVAMTHQRLEWPQIPKDLKAEMVNEAGFIKLLETTKPGTINPELIETLEGFNTWDEVHLNGGLLLKGDVHRLGLGKEMDAWFAARNEDVEASLTQQRSIFSLFSNNPTRVHLSRGSKHVEANIPFGLSLNMHVVGEKHGRSVDWANVERIFVSKPPAKWANHRIAEEE
jgi:hypothetical protein|tara:strand:- start:356 stop:1291 length:936 start_codon:yes stop_codon:yes gene_type:complete